MKSICLILISSLTVIFLFGNIYVSHATPANNFDSLVAYYPFNGNTNDESGNNLHLTNHGAVLTTDRFGTENNAYLFNGSATISCTDDDLLDITSDFTISFWIKNPGSVLHQFVMSKHTAGEDNTGSWGIASYDQGNTYSFVATPHWGFGPPNPTTPIISENKWHHITFIYKKATSEWKSFLDGSVVNSGTQDFSIQNTGKDFMIGSCMGYNLNLTASLDDIRIYNVAMTDSEVQNLYNNEADGLVAYFPFNGNANDESGNGSNPTYIGVGVTLTSDRFGNPDKAYYFDGNAGSYIRMPADKFPTTDRTISFWFNAEQVENHPTPLSYGGDVCSNSLLMIINKGDYPNAYTVLAHCASNFISAPYSEAPINKWYNLTMTISGATQKIFINGELKQTTNTFSAPTFVTGKSAVLGALLFTDGNTVYIDPTAGYFKGKLDDFRFYNTALKDSEVKDLYNSEANGLVAYYPFNGNADDESGNGNNGTVNGASLASDRFNNINKAYAFDGTSNYINVPDATTIRPGLEISITAWVKRTRFGIDIVTEKGGDWTGGTCNYGMGLHNINNNMFYFFFNGGWRGTDGVNDLNWHHYAVVAKNGDTNPVLYIDGQPKSVLYTSGPGTIVMNNSEQDLHIGAQVAYSYYGANWIDELTIYQRKLTAADVQQIYNQSATGLVAYYPFNGNANDESGNGNHGTITGALVTPAADRYGAEGKAYKFWFPDYVSVPTNSSFFTNEFTVSYWYKVASYWGERGVLSCVGKNGGYQQYYVGTNFAYLIGYNFPNGNSFFSSNYTVSDEPNIWHHVTASYQKIGENSSVSKFYINGELKKTDNQPVAIAYPGEEQFNIGKNVDVNFNGELDDIRFYAKALTDQDIKDLYLTETKPVLLTPANQSSVTTLTPEMRWSSPLANAEFRFQLSSDSLFGIILHELVTTDLKTQLPEALLTEGKNYFWRVRTTLNSETGPWSSVWSFNFVNTGLEKPIMDHVSLGIAPNPADASAKIVYVLPGTSASEVAVTIEILNSIGTCTKKLTAKKVQRGNNEIEIETNSLQSGIYYCRLKAGNISIVRKLVIMH
jgi:hypothetical protein